MKDSRLALVFPERRINETRGKFLGGLLIDAVYGGRVEKVEQGPARNRRTFVRKLDERVIKLRKKHVGSDRITRCPRVMMDAVGIEEWWCKRTCGPFQLFQEIIAGRMFVQPMNWMDDRRPW